MHRWIEFFIFVATFTVAAGCRTYGTDRSFELTVPWEDYECVVVRSPKGSVELRSINGSQIHISGTKHADGYTLSQADKRVEHVGIVAEADTSDRSVFVVEVTRPWWLPGRWVGGDFEIRVPAPCAADIRTHNGTITVSGLRDKVVLKTCNGEVAVDGVRGDVRAWTRNGKIVAQDVTGNLVAETTNGGIVAENVTGDFTAQTPSGWIQAKTIRGRWKLRTSIGTIGGEDLHGSVEATGSIGDIHVDVIPSEGDSVTLRTGKGSIDVTLPAGVKADLDLKTGNGVVQPMLDDVPLKVQLWSQNHVKAKMNGGGDAAIVATTSRGLITLKGR